MSGTFYQYVLALDVYNGKLIAGGYFTHSGGVQTNGIAQWDGTSWSSFGSGLFMPGNVCGSHTFCNYAQSLIVGGLFNSAGSVSNTNHLAKLSSLPSVTLNLSMFIEGYYTGGGLMNNYGNGGCLYVNGMSANPTDADDVYISLMDPFSPFGEVEQQPGILQTNGTVSVTFTSAVVSGNTYYIKVMHRNALETWSSAPVLMSATTTYNFTTAATKAYGNNMIQTFDHVGWAFYSGDISDPIFGLGSQDGIIETQDYLDMELAIGSTFSGYTLEDLTGDGVVESSDYALMENNVCLSRHILRP